MLINLLLALFLLNSVLPFCFPRKIHQVTIVTQVLMLITLSMVFFTDLSSDQYSTASWTFIDFDHIKLTLAINIDTLAKIMLTFILVIGFFIYRYAQQYLESDSTRGRFLSQFNLVLLCVLFFVMSANLLTAFIAWQMLGISLYLLLNHYHHAPKANRAAKKKFVINRIGDCSFLLAIVLSYKTVHSTDFLAIQSSTCAQLICGLLFISVMTKCAQFPFHIWLIDTMETPTPVSALMHAGIINAGGILLTRVSSTVVGYPILCHLILLTGLLSAILSVNWMNQQPDIKKKLAYSTMGQMGYMLVQCGLGAFPAAIFHLISHGFYKASLFLNAGETLHKNHVEQTPVFSYTMMIQSFLVSVCILAVSLIIFGERVSTIPLLSYGFMLLTITTLILKVQQLRHITWQKKAIFYLMTFVILYAYLCCFYLFSKLLPTYQHIGIISVKTQISIFLSLLLLQIIVWQKKLNLSFITFKDETEKFLRQFLLNPLRLLGEVINIQSCHKSMKMSYCIGLCFSLLGLVYGLMADNNILFASLSTYHLLLSAFFIVAVAALVIANRCLTIRALIIYLVLFELAFTNIAILDHDHSIIKIGIFHMINISTVLLMLFLLAYPRNRSTIIEDKINYLPSRVFYLVASLLLLIGIPGTASFISEFYLLTALVSDNVYFIVMYILLIVFLAIVVMHSLQLYGFSKHYSSLLLHPIHKLEHALFFSIIALNVICGLHPGLLLSYL